MAKPGFYSSPPVDFIASALKIPRAYAVGICETLWQKTDHWDCEYLGDAAAVAAAVEWPTEDAERLVKALSECGNPRWPAIIELRPDSPAIWQVVDFDAHRSERTKNRVRKKRERDNPANKAFVMGQSRDCRVTLPGQSREVPATVPDKSSPEVSLPHTPSLPNPHLPTTTPATVVNPAQTSENPRPAKQTRTTRPLDIELPQPPEDLYGPDFRAAWAEYVAHRGEMWRVNRKPALTPLAVTKALAQLRGLKDEAWAIIEVNLAIANSWVGVFPKPERKPVSGAGGPAGAGPPLLPRPTKAPSLADRARAKREQEQRNAA